MGTYVAPSTAVVHEVLKMDNYEHWSSCMKIYLKLHDLWETITLGDTDCNAETESTTWKKKNLAALHAIQISCGPDVFSKIKNINSAKGAWETLANRFNPQSQPQESDDSAEQGIPCKGTYVAPNTATVPEFLKTGNYEYWSACIKSHLEAQDLWDTIDQGRTRNEQQRKNSAALHAIQISCGPQFFPEIMDESSAKDAWKALKNKFGPESEPQRESQPQLRGSDVSDDPLRARMMGHITNGDWKGLKAMFDIDPSLIYATIVGDGSTALHKAVESGHLRVVEVLVGMMTRADLEIMDKDIANCLSTACLFGDKDMANCLYTKTSIDVLSQENGKYALEVLDNCIDGEMPDIALDLLHRLPETCKVQVIQNSSVLLNLSFKPDMFPSGLGLAFWQRWIYWRVSVPTFVPSGGPSRIDTSSGSQSTDLEPGVTTVENPSDIGEENPSVSVPEAVSSLNTLEIDTGSGSQSKAP